MEFLLVTSEKLKISLSPQDLKELDITYAGIDYSDPATKQMFVALLERGKEETGFRPRNARLFIEVFPSEEGGCIVFFTCLRGSGHPPGICGALGPEAVVFAFFQVEELLSAACKVYHRYSHRIYKSSLYRLENSYRLVVYPLDYIDNLSILLLGEFGEKTGTGPVLAAFIEEHGKLLVQDTALDTLARYFS